MLDTFDHLPDSTDCWLYATDRPLTEEEVAFLESLFDSFQREWSSHGRNVIGACTVFDQRIVVVAAHIENGDISGCGIDKSLHLLQDAAISRSFDWVSALNIIFEDDDAELQVVSRTQFKMLASKGAVNANTKVVDLSLRSLGGLRESGLLRPASTSWHARLLPQAEEAVG
jgi:hypothetical protein